MFVIPLHSMKELDEEPAREKAMVEAMGEANFRKLMKGTGDVFQSMETMLFAVSPDMSYVSKATEDEDPDFWRPKAATSAAKPAPKASEKAAK